MPASKPSTLRSTMWDLFLRFSGFNSQESKDDRFAMMAMMKCHKHAQSPEFREGACTGCVAPLRKHARAFRIPSLRF